MPWFSYHGGHSGEFCRHAKDDLSAVVGARSTRASRTTARPSTARATGAKTSTRTRPTSARATCSSVRTVRAARQGAARTARRPESRVLVGFETERLPPDDWAERMRAMRSSGLRVHRRQRARHRRPLGRLQTRGHRRARPRPRRTRGAARALLRGGDRGRGDAASRGRRPHRPRPEVRRRGRPLQRPRVRVHRTRARGGARGRLRARRELRRVPTRALACVPAARDPGARLRDGHPGHARRRQPRRAPSAWASTGA